MRVIFVEDIPNVARTGEIKDVKPGYARNYLLPKRLAVAATRQEMQAPGIHPEAGDGAPGEGEGRRPGHS